MNNFKRPNRSDLAPTKVPTVLQIAWAAGVYEGEGTARLTGGNKKTGKIGRGLSVSLPQKDPELIYWLRDWFGGSLAIHTRGKCSTWQCHGDNARIFLALAYEYLTVRRKAQIDATGALTFLGGQSSANMSIDELKEKLAKYYEDHDKTTYYGIPELARAHSRDMYQVRKVNDPSFLENEKLRARRDRAKRTPEQLEHSRRYQQEYYQKKKEKLKLVEIQKSA